MPLFVFVICIACVVNVHSQDISTCSLQGDPHLIPFKKYPSATFPQGYWCRKQGRMTVLINQYIEVYVNVTVEPYWNENYEIIFKANCSTLCTITSAESVCNHPDFNVFRPRTGNGLDIVYAAANDLHVIVSSYDLGSNKKVYDIQIEQSYDLVNISQGLCMQMTSACRLEYTWGKRRRRSVDESNAIKVCNEYMKEANNTARALAGNTGSPLGKLAEEACINDVYTTSQPKWGESAIGFVVLDAIKQAKFTNSERRNKIATAFTSIPEAALRANVKANSFLPICDPHALIKKESYCNNQMNY